MVCIIVWFIAYSQPPEKTRRIRLRMVELHGKLEENLNEFLRDLLYDKEKLLQSQDIKTILDWYGQMEEYRKEGTDGKLSIITNRIIGKLLEHTDSVVNEYTDSVIKKVGIETEFRERTIILNFEINFKPIKPYVEFIKRINGNRVSSVKLTFLLDSTAYLRNIRILRNGKDPDGKSIQIDTIDFELQLSLEQIQGGVIPLSRPINLVNKKFEIKNCSFRHD